MESPRYKKWRDEEIDKKLMKYLHFFEISSSNSNNKDWQWKVRCFHKGIFSFLQICYYSILKIAASTQERGQIQHREDRWILIM